MGLVSPRDTVFVTEGKATTCARLKTYVFLKEHFSNISGELRSDKQLLRRAAQVDSCHGDSGNRVLRRCVRLTVILITMVAMDSVHKTCLQNTKHLSLISLSMPRSF